MAVALVLGGGALALLWPSAPDAPPPEAEVVHASPAAEVEDRPQAAAVVNTAPLEIDVFGDVEEPSRERVRSIRGRVSCPPGAKLGLDDEPVPVSEDGSFTLGPELSGDGLHSLTLVLRDGAGGEVTRELRLRLDTTPPALRVTSPEVAVVGSATVTFRGVVEAEDLDRLLVDGRPVALLDDGSFEAPVVLEGEGLREVVIEAIDAVGNRARLTRRVTYDATAPTVLLEAPEDEALTRSARVGVRGRISDAHPPREVHVSVAGVTAGTASVDSDGRFALEVAVPEGRSALLVRCKDQAGHAASATRIVARDSQAPVITLAHALPGALYGARARYLTLSGSVDDVHARLTVCGKPIKLSRKGRFRERVRLRDGANPIDVVALDRAGNRGEVTGVVEYARRRAKPAPVQVLFYEDFTKASGRKGDAVALLEGGIARSKSTDKIFAAVLQVADYGTHALVTLLPGAKLRLRYRISAPTRGSFKLQLYCAAAKDNLWLFLPLPPDLEWQEIEVDLGRLRTGSPPEALEPVAYTCDNVQLLLGKAGEAVVLEVDDLLIFAPAGER